MYDSIFKRGKKGVYFCGQMQITVTFCVKMCHRVLPTCVRDSITSHKVQISLLIIEGGERQVLLLVLNFRVSAITCIVICN